MKKQKNDARLEERVTKLEDTIKQLVDGVNNQAILWYATRTAYNTILGNFPKKNVQEQPKEESSNEENKETK